MTFFTLCFFAPFHKAFFGSWILIFWDIVKIKKIVTKELETHGLWLWVLWWFLRQFLCGLLRFPDVHCVKYNGVNFIMKYVVNPHKAAEILANCWWDLRLGEGGGRSVQCTFSARPGKCQKSYTNKIVRNQFGVKFPLSTVVKTHIDSNIPIVITSPFMNFFPPFSTMKKKPQPWA